VERNQPDVLFVVAYTSFRLGGIGRAESSFVAAIPRLPRNVRERFDDIAPVSSESDTATLRRLPAAERPEFLRRFWREHDPDLASPENEAQLEYWSRVTQAYFLYYNQKRREWDQRGEVYVRYGPPERAEYNPIGAPNMHVFSNGPGYPLNTLVWAYPSLGMTVSMQDRLLSEYYLMPISRYEDMDPRPDPQVLARRGDLLASRDGRGVFPMMPPGARPLPVEGVLARFSGAKGPRLFGQMAVEGWPTDSLRVDWVVLDTTMTEVARLSRAPGVSECDPAGMRVADFAADLAPGRYVIGMTARGRTGRRGVYRAPIEMRGTPPTLSLSDAMVLCGRPAVEGGTGGVPPAVRLEADPGAVVTGSDPLGVYFEMYDLRPDETGTSRFEYECTVSSAEKDPRIWIQRFLQPRPRIPEISAGRREEQPGNLRRQYVTVPIASLKDGRYRLNVRVRDLNAGSEATTSVEFVKRSGS
jgi:GWxTD domain-containing protein